MSGMAGTIAQSREASVRTEMPSRGDHRWRFTDPATLLPGGSIEAALAASRVAPRVEIILPSGAGEQGVEAGALFPEEGVLDLSRAQEDPWTTLLRGWRQSIVDIRVPGGVRLDDPIEVRVLTSAQTGSVASGILRLWVGPEARVEVRESLQVSSGHAWWITEALLEDGAHLAHRRMDQVGPKGAAFSRAEWQVRRNAALSHGHGVFSEGILKSEAAVCVQGEGAEVDGRALVVAGERARAEWRVTVNHETGKTRSRQRVRAAAGRRGRAVFTGLLDIAPGANETEAYEEARGLAWHPSATVDLLPELEIRHHDVRCSHGASVAPLDEEARFYLQSRGLDRLEAERLLLEGFLRGGLEDQPPDEEWVEAAWRLLGIRSGGQGT